MANRPKTPEVLPYYDRSGLSAEERARADELEALYGFEFPTEVFEFWRWHQRLSEKHQHTVGETLGISLVGPFDVLAGAFDGFESAYPAVLHWRFRFDPPEFVTVWSGDTDGLHWGLWFDDHARRPPVVAGYYARDSFDVEQYGTTLFEALRTHIAAAHEGTLENMDDDPDYKAEYEADLVALQELTEVLPSLAPRPQRTPTPTVDGMGVVEPVTPRLIKAKKTWAKDPHSAAPELADAYLEAERPTLAHIARTYAEHEVLPRVSILDYPVGAFHSFELALANPKQVKLLEVTDAGLSALPDLRELENLEVLSLYGNALEDLPPTLSACRKLREINLFRNPLSKVPEVLFELPSLTEVILPDGLLEMVVDRPFPPGTYRSLQLAQSEPASVKVLELASQGLHEVPDLSAFHNLDELRLFGNELHDLPISLATCQKLRAINLFRNPMSTLPAVLLELPALAELILPDTVPDADRERLLAARPGLEIN